MKNKHIMQNKLNLKKPGNSKRIALLFAFILFITGIQVYAQSARAVEQKVDDLMNAVRADQEKPDLSDLYGNNRAMENLLESARKYFSDTLYSVRLEAGKITYNVALKSDNTQLKQKSLEQLTANLTDENGTVSGWIARHLSIFQRQDFTQTAKSNIVAGINAQIPRSAELIKMAGYLKMTDATNLIRQKANFEKKVSTRWAAYIALARMGDQEYISKVVSAVEKQPLNDDVVYELVPDLVYTRQKECIDYAIKIIYEDKKLCRSSNPDNPERIRCGYRVMEYVAPVIKDFPYKVRTSGDLETDDYKKAFETVREFFKNKGDNYTIIDESF